MPRRDTPPPTPDLSTGQRIVAGLAKVALVFRHSQWQTSGRRGLTPTQSQILALIAGCGKQTPPGVKAVAERLAVTTATASEAVAALVEKGLVRKEADETDGRAVVLRLTARGAREAGNAAEWPAAIVDALEAMPESERAPLLRGIVGMVRTMQERGLVPTSRICVECRYFRPNEYPLQAKAHHCLYIEAPIGDADLRLDCAEMEPADEPARLWEVFVNGKPLDRSGPGAGRARRVVADSRRKPMSTLKGASS